MNCGDRWNTRRDAGCQDSGYWILDTGYRMQETGSGALDLMMVDIGYWKYRLKIQDPDFKFAVAAQNPALGRILRWAESCAAKFRMDPAVIP